MLVDWLTIRVSMDRLTPEARLVLNELGDRICCYCPKTGHVHYEAPRWNSVRSDSHQIAVKAGSDLWIQGSPARVLGDGDTVFGSGASSDLNLKMCGHAMIQFVANQLGITLPWVTDWIVSRVDVTQNYALANLDEVHSALAILARTSGGRFRVSSMHGDTVYYNQKSRLRAGKGYSKGSHLEWLMRQPKYDGRRYTVEEIELAKKILRLELRLGREWFRRNSWLEVTPDELRREFHSYFDRMIGGAEMGAGNDLRERIYQVSDTQGQGAAAYSMWLLITHEGWEVARQNTSKTTWYRNLKVLRKAGLSDADVSHGRVVPLRRKIIECQQVDNWLQLAA